jgi:hypothetical protein
MTGNPVGISVNTVGPSGQWAWHNGADTTGELEANSTDLWADPGFLEKMAEAQGLFVPGRGGQWVYARVD